MAGEIIIGVNHKSYIEKRNFIELPYQKKIEFKKTYDLLTPLNFIFFKLFNKIIPLFQYSYIDFGLNRVSLTHLYCGISFSNKPWITTASTPLPRWGKFEKKGIKRLAHNSCKKIIFISKNVYDLEVQRLEKYPDYAKKIFPKMMVLHPSQKKLISSFSEKKYNKNKIRFTLIGHEILIKGGLEVLKAIERLIVDGRENSFSLTLVSNLSTSNYLKNEDSEKNLEEIKTMIQNHKNSITHFLGLDYEKILTLLKETDVFMLPSYGDTYGYAILEAQASGCPVISTDTMALSEINNNECGWLINVPKKTFNKADVGTIERARDFSDHLTNSLYKTMSDILNDPSTVPHKGKMAFERILNEHNPDNCARFLENLYISTLEIRN